jgi:hypothetical protein
MVTNDLINSQLEAQARQQITESNRKKWKETGLLEGLDSRNEGIIADLLHNQAKQLLKENSNVTNTIRGGEEWNNISLPLIRRVFANMSAKEFVSVQPLNAPSGLVFWLEFKYATGQPGFTTGAERNSQNDSVFGVTDARKGTTPGTGGLYGTGRFGYSINDVSSSAQILVATASLGTLAAGTGSIDPVNYANDINFDSEFSASAALAGSTLKKITVPVANLVDPDIVGVSAYSIVGTGINTHYPKFTTIDPTGTYVSFIVSGSLTSSTDAVLFYQKQPTDITRGDFEETKTQENPLDIPTFKLQMHQDTLVAKTRKLKAEWTPEFAQDIEHYHNIDAQAELTTLLGEYITQEIDFELLDMLLQGAQTIDYWSAKIGFEKSGNTWVQSSANSLAYTQPTWFQTIGTKLRKISNEIQRLTLRGGANFLVAGPKACTILESIEGYTTDTAGGASKFNMGARKAGSINNQWTVYKNPYMDENEILVGYKGDSFLEAGAVYAPYIPLELTPVVYDPDNLTPRVGIMTRYAKKLLRPEFYGKLYIHGLDVL